MCWCVRVYTRMPQHRPFFFFCTSCRIYVCRREKDRPHLHMRVIVIEATLANSPTRYMQYALQHTLKHILYHTLQDTLKLTLQHTLQHTRYTACTFLLTSTDPKHCNSQRRGEGERRRKRERGWESARARVRTYIRTYICHIYVTLSSRVWHRLYYIHTKICEQGYISTNSHREDIRVCRFVWEFTYMWHLHMYMCTYMWHLRKYMLTYIWLWLRVH